MLAGLPRECQNLFSCSRKSREHFFNNIMSKYVKCKTDNVKCSYVDFVEGTSARKYKINLIILYFARLLVPL